MGTLIEAPKTCTKLYERVNELFIAHPFISRKAWEEDYSSHTTYATGVIAGKAAEERIVNSLWNMFLHQKENGVTNIWWRRKPTVSYNNEYFPNFDGLITSVDGVKFTREALEDELTLHFPNKQFVEQLIMGIVCLNAKKPNCVVSLRCSLYPFDKVIRSVYEKKEGEAIKYVS